MDNIEKTALNLAQQNSNKIGNLSGIPEGNLAQAVLNDRSQLAEITNDVTVSAVSNVFNLDLSKGLNFKITINDSVAKTITISNVPSKMSFAMPIAIELTYTVAAAITYSISGINWQNGVIPAFTAGKMYYISLTPVNNGASFNATSGGVW